MLTPHQIELVKATVPVLQAHGVDLTKHFYARMLSKTPELRNVFHQAHQARGAQQQALAAAVLAYAQNIEHPENLLGAVKQIAQRHCSLGIRAEQYQIVGHHLIESIKEVLGAAATPELIDAWTAAYGMLADILIKAEQDIYNQQTAAQPRSGIRRRRLLLLPSDRRRPGSQLSPGSVHDRARLLEGHADRPAASVHAVPGCRQRHAAHLREACPRHAGCS